MANGLTFKVQTLTDTHGWVLSTRAGDTIEEARDVLEGYRQNWPAQEHRLVRLGGGGWTDIVPESQAS